MSRIKPAALILGAALLAAPLPATAQVRAAPSVRMGADEAQRLARIEQAVRNLESTVYAAEGRGGSDVIYAGADPVGTPDQAVRLGSLEREVQELTGRIEQMAFQLQQQQRTIDTLAEAVRMGRPMDSAAGQDNPFAAPDGTLATTGGPMRDDEFVSDKLERGASLPPVEGPARTAPAIPSSVPGGADAAYQQSYNFLMAGDFENAEAGFQAFVERYPDDPKTADATFFLGEIHLALGANASAATDFIDYVRNYPDDERAAEAHYKLGTAFARLDKASEACRVWSTAERRYDAIEPRLKGRIDRAQSEAGCV